ncbi:RING-H2 finger protein ATL3-like [Lycium ferocissimum]|uniref:RING-H2 finger protein ATL3-like n=1 Tax=Lycium ferocissimum TaxID=112874 RepID=UPI0028151191|nr:RING-H2 finger protein ATL3-like [Lycium ferocissimum]
MADTFHTPSKINDSSVFQLTGKILVVAIVVLFLVLFFIFSLHLYSKWFWNRHRQAGNSDPNITRRRRRFDFSPGHQEVNVTTALFPGLEPSVLKTIPVVLFNPKEFKDGLECAVCLCDVSEGEKARLLPKCNHGFHVDCIDMWFQSHSTCPLCRNPVSKISSDQNPISQESTVEEEVPNFPTNVLFWGNETQVSTFGPSLEESLQGSNSSNNSACPPPPPSSSSSSSGSTSDRPCVSLVIDIPRPINEVEEEHKSPMPTRLRSLKRLLSRDRRGNPSSPRNVDVEQGGR